jgi:hypothetical protein
MRAKSIKGKSSEEIHSELKQSISDGFKPTLAIVFISIKLDRKAICDLLHNQGIDSIGATSCGAFINGYQEGYEGVGSAVILLLDLNPQSYCILFEDIGERNLDEVAAKLAREALQKFKKPAFILCSTGVSTKGEFLNGEVLVRSMERIVGRDTKIYGGMAGDDATFTGTYVFNEQQSSDLGLAALILDEEKISLQGMAVSGWKPLGIERTATKCEGAWLYTIDGKPALDMYLKYLGKEPVSGEDKYKLFEDIGIYYPFQVEGIGDPVMRTPVMINNEKSALKLDFDVPQGTKLRFSMPPDFDIVENILESATELKNKSESDAEALLIFSCVGRLSALGPFTTNENEGLSKIWNAPMVGFFTYGEYGTVLNDRQGFHSTTCSWVALKEK